MATKTVFTIADYLELDEPDGPHYELSDGELIVSPSTTHNHNEVRDRLANRLRLFSAPARLGVIVCEVDLQLGPATIRRPDVGFIFAARYKREYGEMVPIPIAPDLAFEVVSKHDRPAALKKMLPQYLDVGTKAVWLLYPAKGEAHRHVRGGEPPQVHTRDLIEPALPGFKVPLSELFEI
ncbi:MAG TPA: Uma2 family endonuclease [Terriglobales bacterium]|nr:Uma2 family endonuclease [Terriglobales bacterium]